MRWGRGYARSNRPTPLELTESNLGPDSDGLHIVHKGRNRGIPSALPNRFPPTFRSLFRTSDEG